MTSPGREFTTSESGIAALPQIEEDQMRRLSITSMCVAALVLALGASQVFAAAGGGSSVPRAAKLAGPTPPAGGLSLLGAGVRSLDSYSSLAPLSSGSPRMGIASRSLAVLSDDNIPGVELPLSADVSGTVDPVTNPNDVYRFYLEAGASIRFHLNAATPTSKLALYLFGPEATDVNTSDCLAVDASYSYPTDDVFTATTGGYYFANVYAKTGTSAYTLPYTVYMSTNDEIPGVPVSASPITQWADAVWDWDDVSSLPLRAGDTLTMHLGANPSAGNSPDFDADLFLLGPAAAHVAPHDSSLNTGIVAASETTGTNEDLSYVATATGTYYVDAATCAGYGAASLTWRVNPVRPGIKRSPGGSKLTCKRKKGSAKLTLSAWFADQFALPIKGASVRLQTSADRKKWKNKASARTNSKGLASVKITAKTRKTRYYRWYRPASSTSTRAYSAAQKVIIK